MVITCDRFFVYRIRRFVYVWPLYAFSGLFGLKLFSNFVSKFL